MNNTALITGASSGIGLELARVHAAHGDNLVLVARNKSKLDELKKELEKEYHIFVFTIKKDLSQPDAAQEVYDEINSKSIRIDYLINNAGFGDFGMFSETSWEKELRMINLNIVALTQFTKLYLKEMLASGSGKIMNVSSTAAFMPGPKMAVYFATKAFVQHFSEAVANEVSGSGVTVTALCPGATESGFTAAAGLGEDNFIDKQKTPTSREVAEYGYKTMMKGKTVAIHGMKNYLMANSVRLVPRALAAKSVRFMMER